jgi:ABC-type Zn uptake system ZnuABC Zn-binding protein ZnuA
MKSRTGKRLALLSTAGLLLALIAACGSTAPDTGHEHDMAEDEVDVASLEPVPLGAGEKLKAVATTNIVGDVVDQVGGDRIELTTLMSAGVDPHSYVATPADTAALHDAHVVFANGLGLEADLEEILHSAGGDAVEIHLSHELEHLSTGTQTEDAGDGHEHEEDVDPHVWFDVTNVMHWVETIETALSALDPANAGAYQASAKAYGQQLADLDAWVVEQMANIPQGNRKLVTNHPAFGYLAARYGLEQVGAVYPVSPSAEPSAQDIAALEDTIREYGVPAVFTESTVNPKLAQQVAEDTDVKLVTLYSGSLGGPGSGVESYILLIRYDVNAIVDALK